MAVNMSVRSRPSIHEKVLNVNITLSETNYKATSQENGESHSQSEESNIESGTKCEDNMKDESPKGMPQIGRTSAKTRKSPSPSKVSEIASNNLDQEHTNTGILPSVVTNRSVIVAVAAVCVYIAYGQFNSEKTCSFKELKVKYPQLGNKVWHTLQFGIEPILNKKERNAAVYLFAHHGGITAQEVIKEIASYTSGCYGNSLVEMEKNDFTSSEAKKDYGHAIEKYKMKIKEGKVVLIANLNENASMLL
ncbi:uncharacterized protein LOC106089976 isoform X2 [Stomoxys calcitrans]|uniref:Uncharacterized protein n=1 Tax=Stomoxys calcitrans TaxID=35570 RepID=A0A1I8P392_STOCA|nr:uncharacterized protein LOC106089976 isoform X2 [Stomoxys calcitrans]